MIIAIVLLVVLAMFICALFLFTNRAFVAAVVCIVLTIGFAVGSVYMYPEIIIKIRESEGRAQLAQATANRRIQVEEATAKRDSAALLSEAEVLRAKGVAEANRIVADGLGGPEGYLRYLYIEGLKESQSNGTQIIYVPTEAGLPILEAARLQRGAQ